MTKVFDDAQNLKAAVLEAEMAHPDSPTVKRIHDILTAALPAHGPKLGLTKQQIVALGGGTPKTEDPV